jgi:hypothetical protein
MEKVIKEINHKTATGDGDVLRLLGQDGLKLMTWLLNSVYVTGEWPRVFIEVTVIALKKKPKAAVCSDHHTGSLIPHTAKTVARILRRRIEIKIEDVLGEHLFGFRRGKGTRDAIGMLNMSLGHR